MAPISFNLPTSMMSSIRLFKVCARKRCSIQKQETRNNILCILLHQLFLLKKNLYPVLLLLLHVIVHGPIDCLMPFIRKFLGKLFFQLNSDDCRYQLCINLIEYKMSISLPPSVSKARNN